LSTEADALAQRALQALQGEDPRAARELLMKALEGAPHRADLVNALGVVHLHLGEPELGKPLIEQAVTMALAEAAMPDRKVVAETMLEGFLLGLAAACEDLDLPGESLAAYQRLLTLVPGQPRAQNGLAHLLLAWGRPVEGMAALGQYIDEDRDEPAFQEGAEALMSAIERVKETKLHPRMFLEAHRGSYVEFFDHHAEEQGKAGWIAEAARMKRDERGQIVPSIPQGARPYAAVRVDLVNPQTSEVGQVGDQPMIVALAGYEALARTPVAFEVIDEELPLWISTQAPWDQLPIQVLFRDKDGAEALDVAIGGWYLDGWKGAFGTTDDGRFHYVSDPEVKRDGRGVVYHVDCGRARFDAIPALIDALTRLHRTHPMTRVLIGRGHLP